MNSARLRQLRDHAILYVYEHGAGHPAWAVGEKEVQQAIGASKEEFSRVAMMLWESGLSGPGGPIGMISLNASGRAEAERLGPITSWSEASRPPSPPVIVSNTATGAVVQINTGSGSRQNITVSGADAGRLDELAAIMRQVEAARLPAEALAEVRDGLASLQDAIAANRPAILPALASAVAATLKSAGGAVGAGLAAKLLALFG